jgi:hypothetical protein
MTVTAAINDYLAGLEAAGWDTSRYHSVSLDSVIGTMAKQLQPTGSQGHPFSGMESICEYFARIAMVERSEDTTLDQLVLLPSFIPLELNEALDLWEFFSIDPHMQRGLFPIMHDYHANYLCVDIIGDSETNGRVFECLQGYRPWPLYRSIEALFRIHAIAAARRVIFVDSGRYLSVNYQQMSKLIDAFADLATNPPD